MLSRGDYHYIDIYFDGYDYHAWKTRMLDLFQIMGPDIERIIDDGYSFPLDPMHLILEEDMNYHLNAMATNAIFREISDAVLERIMPLEDANEIWLKLQDIYEDTNDHYHSPNQGKGMVSDEDNFTIDELIDTFISTKSIIAEVNDENAKHDKEIENLSNIISTIDMILPVIKWRCYLLSVKLTV
jgi:hypothetical protein